MNQTTATADVEPTSADSQAPEPTFDAIDLSPELRRAVDDLGFVHPSPVQLAVFKPAAEGKDVVVQARTGTGKTAAFGLPIIDALVNSSEKHVQVLVLSPTRELALQIHRELEALSKYHDVTSTAIYGGAPMQPQIDAINDGAQIIAGTPGRVLDHLERRTIDPSGMTALVLDESDEMLSMGFLPQITKIMEALPESHQTLLFSATLPPDVKRIAETRLHEPTFITLSGDHIGALSIDHYAYRSRGSKAQELVQLIEAENPESAIVFCNTRDQTKRVAQALKKAGYAADWLNADLSQSDREKVMRAVREERLRFLVATDVAARGIDISHLTHVINADFPESTENYVHRTGRTGRAGRTGTAISLIGPKDVGNLYMLRLTYKIFPVERELPSSRELQSRKEADLVQFLHSAFAATPARADDLSLARRILTSEEPEVILAGLLRDHLHGHPDAEKTAAEERRAKPSAPVSTDADPKPAQPRRSDVKEDASPATRSKKGETRGKASKGRTKDKSETARVERPAETDKPRQKARSNQESRPSSADELEVVSAESILGGSVEDLVERETMADNESRASGRDDRPRTARARKPRTSPEASGRDAAPREPVRQDEAPAEETTRQDTRASLDEDIARIFVNIGRKDDVDRKHFVTVLEKAGVHPDDVEFVKVRETHTFVGVVSDLLHEAISALDGAQVGAATAKAEQARARR